MKAYALLTLLLVSACLLAAVPHVHGADVYRYTFNGCYDEDTHFQTAVNVTSFFTDNSTYTFEVNGSSTLNFDSRPVFFRYDLGTYDREFWVESSDNNTNLYIFNHTSLYTYTLQFNDLVGRLNTYQYVELKSYVNGTSTILDKRKVDVAKKVLMTAVINYKYDLELGGYTYGDLQFTTESPITLDVTGLEFPDNVIMGYRYVRCYALRQGDGTIYAYYEDTLEETTSVVLSIYYQNDSTLLYTTTATNSSWVFSYSGADNGTDYYLTMVASHATFGTLTYSQVLSRLYETETVWDLSILGGESLGFEPGYLIPMFIVLCCAGVFSSLNTWLGLGVTVAVAWICAVFFGLPVSVDILIFAFAMAIIFAIVMLRRRTY